MRDISRILPSLQFTPWYCRNCARTKFRSRKWVFFFLFSFPERCWPPNCDNWIAGAIKCLGTYCRVVFVAIYEKTMRREVTRHFLVRAPGVLDEFRVWWGTPITDPKRHWPQPLIIRYVPPKYRGTCIQSR